MKIGILQCGHTVGEIAENHGDYAAMFQRLLKGSDFEFRTYNVVDMNFPNSVNDCDGWLLTGSRFGVYEDLEFIPPLEDFIRLAYGASIPMVGICFGHQIIAQALGGKVEKFSGGWAIGRQTYAFDDLGETALNALHQDQVIDAPQEAKVIASNEFCKNAALVYGNRALTIQAHPEFSREIIGRYVKMRRGMPGYSDELMDRAEEKLAEPIDDTKLAQQIVAFFRKPRGTEDV